MRFLSKVLSGSRLIATSVALVGVLMMMGCGSSSSSMSGNGTATPTFSPGGGTYNTSQSVTIADTTPGAALYCTTDGTTPTTASPHCSQPTTVYQTEFLQAIAVAPNMAPSAVASAGYTINLNGAATPTFTPAGGTYTSAQTVTIATATTGANIYYTVDGSVPTQNSTLYAGPVTVSQSETLSAIAVASGLSNSGVASATYSIVAAGSTPAAAPAISPNGGTFTSAQTVTITDTSSGANVYYSIDGSTPSATSPTSTLYSGPITVSASETIKAIATGGGFTDSPVTTAAFTISSVTTTPAAAPTISPNGGTFTSAQTVTIADSSTGTSIYYSVDGSMPSSTSSTSTLYSGPITVSATETVKAIATGGGFTDSPVTTAAFTITAVTTTPAAAPTISPNGGTFTSAQTVTIADDSTGVSIYYSVDGSTPSSTSSTSTLYSGPITVSATETVKAIATGGGFTDSPVTSAAFTISVPTPAAAPVFSPNGGSFTSQQTVTITDASMGASIYYSVDGSTPSSTSSTSTLYSGPIAVSASETIKAIATGGGFLSSMVTSAVFTIQGNTGPAAAPTFTPNGGSFTTSPQTVTISSTSPGVTIYYTINGNPPTHGSQLYAGPVTLPSSATINAIATGNGFTDSTVATQTFTINIGTAETPTITPATGSFTSSQTVTISDASPNAIIYYTIDGSAPAAAPDPSGCCAYTASIYTGPFTAPSTTTVKAIAAGNGYTASAVASETLTITNSGVAAPVFIPGPGELTVSSNIDISSATPGVTIYCTYDGSTPIADPSDVCPGSPGYYYFYPGMLVNPDSQITLYNAPFTFKAIAVLSGQPPSAETDGTYTFNFGTADVPTFSPDPSTGGTYTNPFNVKLSQDEYPGSVLYYTTDGSTPTTASQQYQPGIGQIPVSGTTTVKVLAASNGYTAAPVVSATYNFTPVTTATPQITPGTGTYASAQTVTISDSTPGASIFYTADGSTPTASSTPYTAPLTVSSTETIQAIASATNYVNSAVASSTITIGSAGGSVALTGKVLSGTSTAVSGSQVQLYQASQDDYGAAANSLGSATTGADGSFSISFACPTNPNDLVYLVATGGDTTGQGGNNASLEFMTGLGSCNTMNIASPVVVNEATTVASAYALAQFMGSPTNVGTSGNNYQGLANAFLTIPSMVNLATGQVYTHTPAYPATLTDDSAVVNNSTVPQSRINTLANALNACAISSSGCSDLFTAATQPSGTAPSTTLQAILYIAQNPGTNVASLFSAAPSTGPFQPVLGAAPGDWTLALTFTGGGLGITQGALSPSQAETFDPVYNAALAIDANGNIVVSANATAGYGSADSGGIMFATFNNQGAPQTPATSLFPQGANSVVSYGGFTAGPGMLGTMVFDGYGNLWVGINGTFVHSGLEEFSPSLTVLQSDLPDSSEEAPTALAVDGGNNIWLAESGYPNGFLEELDNNGNLLSVSGCSSYYPATTCWSGISTANPTGFSPDEQQILFDSNSQLWAEGYTGDTYLVNPSNGQILFDPWYNSSDPTTYLGSVTPLITDNAGNVYGCGAADGMTLNVYNSLPTPATTNSYTLATGRGCGMQMVLDGQGHIFAVNVPYPYQGGTPTIDEFTTAGQSISPTLTGYTGTSAGEAPTINPDFNQYIVSPAVPTAAIDGSGNLWILNADAGAQGTPGNVLVKYVGIGAPVLTPTALALQYGEIGERP